MKRKATTKLKLSTETLHSLGNPGQIPGGASTQTCIGTCTVNGTMCACGGGGTTAYC